MSENSPTTEPRRARFQFGISSLLVLTLLVACILSVNTCLGPIYGWITALPLGIVAALVLYTRWRCTLGALIGFWILALVGVHLIIGFERADPRFFKAMVTLGSFGAACGASVHTIALRRQIVGGIMLALSIVAFLACLLI